MTGREKYFTRHILRRGDGLECPNEGSSCLINLLVSQGEENVLFEDKDTEWLVGQDSGYVSEIVNECLEEMHAGEVCRISIHPCQELQDHLKKFKTSEKLAADYQIELISFEKVKNSWELTFEERCSYALEQKAKGTRYHKAGLWLFAARHYSKALKSLILARCQLPSDKNNDDFYLLQVQCHSNLAACQLKLERYQHVLENCTKVIQMDSANIKAFYRRAQACIALNDFDEATSDLKKALLLDPKNREVLQLKKQLSEKIQLHDQATAKAMGKMFRN
ncbi:peptidyl-prolyl cis-trans isomerase FKBP62-like [Paramuricea clavata]|uniref:Peptidyl-prolyl cis-trans isomerase FKBP62-like n=1 Tax=Paramuricea clavata TaxID=317549 RepID=A0A6S7I321_PARCT|nr:peptidyl-prolyl cis-trans isomerase FKBP62-like [Paramuricea clavata]